MPRAGPVDCYSDSGRGHLTVRPLDSDLVPLRAVAGRGEESCAPGFRATPNRRPARAGGFMYSAPRFPASAKRDRVSMLRLLHCSFFQGADAVQPCPVFVVMAVSSLDVLPEPAGFAACCSIPME